MRYIARLLRNNYSDTLLATMREIIANALDVSNGRKPMVILPSKLKQDFIVRDYGVGLSEEDMFGLYTKYGKSTKRGTNNAIGGFGLGRFAPLSYTSSFIVISVFNGKKTSYSILIDENDDTVVTKLLSEDSNEENGLYVQVPIATNDVGNFLTKFFHFSRYIEDSLDIKNPIEMKREEASISTDVFDLFYDNRTIYYSGRQNDAKVLMGGILYKVETNENWPSIRSGVVYKAEIGEFDLHHGREQLEYSKRTELALKKASDRIADSMRDYVSVKMSQCDNYYDAVKFANQFSGYLDHLNLSRIKFSFNGKEVGHNIFHPDLIDKDKSYVVSYARNGTKLVVKKVQKWGRVATDPSENDSVFFILDDEPSPRAILNRLRWVNNEQKVLIIGANGKDSFEALKDIVESCDHKNVSLLSQHERAITKPTSRKKPSSGLSKGDILSFNCSPNYANEADYWFAPTEEFDDNKTYYYVRYHANKVRSLDGGNLKFLRNQDSPRQMKHFVRYVKDNADIDLQFYGVRSNALSKVKKMKNWIPLEDYVVGEMYKSKKLENLIKVNKLYGKFDAYQYSYRYAVMHCEVLKKKTKCEIVRDFATLFLNIHSNHNETESHFLPDELVKSVSIEDENKIWEKFEKEYPLQPILLCSTHHYSEDVNKSFLEYFNC